MSNPRFYAGELDACTYTMTATEDAAYPLSNLHSYIWEDYWKSSSMADNQLLKIDLGSALARTTVIIDGHNLGDQNASNIYLQYDTNDSSGFANPVNAATLSLLGNGRILVTFGSVTKRYWRIHFGANLVSVPRIGNLFISNVVDAGFTYVYPYSTKNEGTPSSLRRSVSGLARSTRTYGAVTKFRITFDVLSDTFRTAWLRFHQKVIGHTPFYFYDCDDTGWYVFLTDEVDLEQFQYQLNRTSELNMETQGVGQNPL